jgi:pimeloyl-ACP methyl ester carboxylesterase
LDPAATAATGGGDVGEGEEPVLVLVHGFGASSDQVLTRGREGGDSFVGGCLL